MSINNNSLDQLLQDATDHLNAGRKDEARDVLREALSLDRNHLATWELLWRAAYNLDEELYSLKRILSIAPKHAAAKKRLAVLQPAGVTRSKSQPLARAAKRPSSNQRKQQASVLLLLLGGFVMVVCVGISGLALYRGGYTPFLFSSNLTATALVEKNASCQELIDRTIQASANYCDNTSSNTACYGNNTLKAELVPNTARRFSERGDMIAVNELQRLSASPLNLASSEWGIAVFKVVANLPRSLPGETVTMVVFGNSTLDNQSGTSDSLESFYFSSELGQIVCEKVPFDGLMISSPDGSGVRFNVNGAELTLMGSASIKAVKNEEMEVTVYQGSAKIVANGQEQYFGAGQKTTVKLGGENGTESISVPSEPEALTGEELTTACTMTGQFCSPSEIVPVSEEQAQNQIQAEITSTPTTAPTPTVTRTSSPTEPPTYTAVVLPSVTPTKKPTFTATITKANPTRTPVPANTNTPVPANTNTPTRTSTPTFTSTSTTVPTPTPINPIEAACLSVSLSALTNPNSNELAMDITNNNGSLITIDRFFAYWVKSSTSQKIDKIFLNGIEVWDKSDPDSPSDIPTEGNWLSGSDLTIPDTATRNLVIQFSDNLPATGFKVHLVFDINCQVIGIK